MIAHMVQILVIAAFSVLGVFGCHSSERVPAIVHGEWFYLEPGRGPKLVGFKMDIDDRGYQGELVEWHLCEDRFMGWGTAYREKLRIISGTPMLKLESESGVRLVFDGVDIKAHWPDRDRYNNLTMVRGRGTLTAARKQWETTRDDSVRKMCKDVYDTPLVKDKGANGN